MRKILIGVSVIVGVLAGALFVFWEHPKIIRVGEKVFRIEKARTPEEKKLGLGERETLCGDCGMLFLFSGKERPGFWMKGMRFGLDILWIAQGKVVHIDREIPADSQEIFFPPVPIEAVLEVNSGLASGLEEGMEISFD